MKKYKLKFVPVILGILFGFANLNAQTLILDNFNGSDIGVGGPGDVNGGFNITQNSSGTIGTVVEAGGFGTVTSGTSNNVTMISSKSDFSVANPFTVTWILGDNTSIVNGRNIRLSVQTGAGGFGSPALTINLLNSGGGNVTTNMTHQFTDDATYFTGVNLNWDASSAITIAATFDTTGYSVEFSTVVGPLTGTWDSPTSGTFTSFLDGASDARVAGLAQSSGGVKSIAEFGSISVVAIPEPSTFATLSVVLGFVIASGIRRRFRK